MSWSASPIARFGSSTNADCAAVQARVKVADCPGARGRISSLRTRLARSANSASALLRPPVSTTARSYSGPKRVFRDFERRICMKAYAAPSTMMTTTAMMARVVVSGILRSASGAVRPGGRLMQPTHGPPAQRLPGTPVPEGRLTYPCGKRRRSTLTWEEDHGQDPGGRVRRQADDAGGTAGDLGR